MDDIKIRRAREIITEQILFKKRISVGDNIFEYPISYMTRNLILQTPIVYIPYSTYKVGNKITFDFYFLNLEVDRDMEYLKNLIEKINSMTIDKIKSSTYKKHVFSKKDFISNIKEQKGSCMNEKPDKMRVTLYDNIMAFDEHSNPISLDYLKYKTYLKLLISPTKIWINNNKFGVFWEVMQVKIYPKPYLNKYMFLDDKPNPQLSTGVPPPPPPPPPTLNMQNDVNFNSRMATHPSYKKYFDMVKKGVPKQAVKNKMLLENVDPKILDEPQNKLNIDIYGNQNQVNTQPNTSELFKELLSKDNKTLRKTEVNSKRHFKKKENIRSSFTPSLNDILNARNSLKKKSDC